MAKKQTLGLNSSSNIVRMASEVSDRILLPAGVILRNEDEMVIWDQFTRTRTREEWRDFDLLIVAKAVRLEADLRGYQNDLDGAGAIVINERGTPIVNPLLTVIDSLQRQQLALIRSISLTQTAKDPRTMNGHGKEQSKIRGAINSMSDLISK